MKIKIVSIAKNEGRYITEWLSHHLSIGADEIMVFDNESTDETTQIILSASRNLPVKYFRWESVEGLSPQLSAYNFALNELCEKGDLVGFIDIDEFLIPKNDLTLKDAMRRAISLRPDAGAICINQRVFGSSRLEHYSPEPVLKRFELCSQSDYDENHWVKSFYKVGALDEITGSHSSRLLRGVHIHPSSGGVEFDDTHFGRVKTIDYSVLQLNHYITKSLEEFLWKRQRGGVIGTDSATRMQRYENMDFFHGRQTGLNVQKDPFTEPYAARIQDQILQFLAEVTND